MPIPAASSAPFNPAFLLWRDVNQFGAKGNGVTDDSNAILAAIATNQQVYLQSGSTYIISKPLSLSAGQSLYMVGATLKLANQVIDSTTTNIATGSSPTSITVTNGSQWQVGQTLTVYNGGSYDPTSHTIISIAGNVLVVGNAFTVAFPSGGTVYQTMQAVTLNGGAQLVGGTIDGNYANWSWGHWEVTDAVVQNNADNLAQQVTIQNYWGEGMIMYGTNNKCVQCVFNNLNGNGIHFSGANHPLVDGCYITNVNQNTAVGHANGCVILSNTISWATITNCYMSGGITGIGSIDSYGNSDGVASNNFIYNMTTAGIDMPSSSATDIAVRWVFTGNQIHACPYGIRVGNISSALTVTGATNATPIVVTVSTAEDLVNGQNITIWGVVGNTAANGSYYAKVTGYSTTTFGLYYDSALTLPVAGNGAYSSGGSAISMVSDVSLVGNEVFDCTTNSLLLTFARSVTIDGGVYKMSRGSGQPTNVSVNDCIGLKMPSGVITGGNYGLYIQSNAGIAQDIKVSATCRLQYAGGLFLASNLSGCTGIAADGMTISAPADPETSSSYVGVTGSPGIVVKNCDITQPSSSGACMSCSGNGNIFLGNRTKGGAHSAVSSGGSSGNIVAFNVCDTAMSDGGSAGANQFVSNYDAAQSQITSAAFVTEPGSGSLALMQPYGPSSSISLEIAAKGAGLISFYNHLASAQNASSLVVGSAAGTGASVTGTFGENFGRFTITTGTGATAGQLAVMTSQIGWQYQPGVVFGYGDALSPFLGLYITWSSGSNKVININAANAPASGTTYTVFYFCAQTG